MSRPTVARLSAFSPEESCRSWVRDSGSAPSALSKAETRVPIPLRDHTRARHTPIPEPLPPCSAPQSSLIHLTHAAFADLGGDYVGAEGGAGGEWHGSVWSQPIIGRSRTSVVWLAPRIQEPQNPHQFLGSPMSQPIVRVRDPCPGRGTGVPGHPLCQSGFSGQRCRPATLRGRERAPLA